MKKIIAKIAKGFFYLLGGLLSIFLLFLLIVRLYSPGEEPDFKNEHGDLIEGSISEIENKEVNGVAQRLVIRGKDPTNPILLRVHGGPGLAHFPPIYRKFNTSLEDSFTVVYWDQRGAWPTSSEDIPESSITLEQIVDDGLIVAEYLKNRFGKEKIYIEGYSWGTVVSALMVQKNPELFHAYIGIGQVANQPESELLSYRFALSEAQKANDVESVAKLNDIGPPPYPDEEKMWAALLTQRSVLSKYVPKPDISTGEMLRLILFNTGASFGEKFRYLTGRNAEENGFILWPANATANLQDQVLTWNVPVFFIHGEHDHQTEYSVAESYFDSINAPTKQFHEFRDAGHIAIAWDPDRYRSIMLNEVLSTSKQ